MALSGITVVDLTRILAGPWCTRVLADLGARVIKVESPKGANERGDVYAVATYNHGKESIVLDWMNDDADRETFHKLLDTADVLVENYRSGVMESVGMSWGYIHERWPRLVFCSIAGFGSTGPNKSRPAMDIIIQAAGGLMALTGVGDKPALLDGLADMNAGLHAALGIQAAIISRHSDSKGRFVDISMQDAAMSLLQTNLGKYDDPESNYPPGSVGRREEPKRKGTRGSTMTPFETYHTKDHLLCVIAYTPRDWPIFCTEVLQRPDLVKHELYRNNPLRMINQDSLTEEIESVLKTKGRDEWIELLKKAGLPWGKVHTMGEIVNDPQLRHRNMIASTTYKSKTYTVTGAPIKISGFPDSAQKPPPPTLGEHTEAIKSRL